MSDRTCKYRVTVVTRTYERAHTLPETYRGLTEQTFKDFEWVVVDDGSTDETADLVKSWQAEANFPIDYIYQENRGQHAAINAGLDAVRGEFITIVDSDDYFVPRALERFLYHWENIPEEIRDEFAGVRGLCQAETGEIVGSEYPEDVFDAHTYQMRYEHDVKGDKKQLVRSSILCQYRFPLFPGETYLPESVIWRPIAAEYRYRHVNEVVQIVNYRPDGLTAQGDARKFNNPMGQRYYHLQLIRYPDRPSVLKRLHNYAKYVRYSIHAGVSIKEFFSEAPSKAMLALASPAGFLIYLDDIIRRIPRIREKTE